jgi:hypothetical protein
MKIIRSVLLVMTLTCSVYAGEIPNDIRVMGNIPNNVTAAGDIPFGVGLLNLVLILL